MYTGALEFDLFLVGSGDSGAASGDQLNGSKELCLFWYGEKPSIVNTLLNDKSLQGLTKFVKFKKKKEIWSCSSVV